MRPVRGRALCWEASHGAVLVSASAFPPGGGAWASPFAKTLSEGSPCLRLLWHCRPPEFLLRQSLGCWGEPGSTGAMTIPVRINGKEKYKNLMFFLKSMTWFHLGKTLPKLLGKKLLVKVTRKKAFQERIRG